MTYLDDILSSYSNMLIVATPDEWLTKAITSIDTLLIDHANCEKKAAATAMNLMFRYIDNLDLQNKMSRLAREELRHFEQVLALMSKRNISYTPLTASRYALFLRKEIRNTEPQKLIDTLIIGALIEARSCERFNTLASRLENIDLELAKYYKRLCKSEERHFKDYLCLAAAKTHSSELINRIDFFCKLEKKAIISEDSQFRFHSGIPIH